MTDRDKLTLLKINLGIVTEAFDDVLLYYLKASATEITREGITLHDDDFLLEVMYAAWLWRRRDTGDGMPRMLRYALNNRLFSEKAGDTDG